MFIISYTPTISALLRARAKRKCDQSDVRLLAIGQGTRTLDGWGALPGVERELNSISSCSPRNDVLLLHDKEATVARVLKELTNYSWVHFCCHGHQDLQPMDSALHMHDGPISMRDFMQINMAHAQFAFLSACETATGCM
jgi:CHAT domain-containing protein